MLVTVVTRLYRSASTIRRFHQQVRAAAQSAAWDLEIILVNDDSPDDSLKLGLELVAEDSSVRLIDLSRTFGEDKALFTGLEHATGDLIFTADCNEPACTDRLSSYYERMLADYADSVYGSPGDPRLMNRAFLTSLLENRDREVHLTGLYKLIGYRQSSLPSSGAPPPISRRFRRGLRERRAHAAFSAWPLLFVSVLGASVLTSSLAAAVCLLVYRAFFGPLLAGWPSLIVSIWLLGGLALFCLGVLALYLRKILLEVRDRPDVIVREVLRPGLRQG